MEEQTSVNVYFTCLNKIWEELSNFRPKCTCNACTCGGVAKLDAYYQHECVMAFLIGLSDSQQVTRSQILLMDPLPTINRVFALVSQDEKQKSIHQSNLATSSAVSFVAKTEPYRKNFNANLKKQDRPWCNRTGHTIDKCFKLHGFPPGYKPRNKSPSTGYVHEVSNQFSTPDISNSAASLNDLLQGLNSTQCQQLAHLFSKHMQASTSGCAGTNLVVDHDSSLATVSCVSAFPLLCRSCSYNAHVAPDTTS